MLGNHLNIISDISKFDLFSESISETNDSSSFSLVINYPCSNTSFCDPIEAYIKPGAYLFEVWGAQGGKGCDGVTLECTDGANGGHAAALFSITSRTKIYFNIGGKGTDGESKRWMKADGGNNGGGDGGFDGARTYVNGGGGGGGTDVRLESNLLTSRIIAAGGVVDQYVTRKVVWGVV